MAASKAKIGSGIQSHAFSTGPSSNSDGGVHLDGDIACEMAGEQGIGPALIVSDIEIASALAAVRSMAKAFRSALLTCFLTPPLSTREVSPLGCWCGAATPPLEVALSRAGAMDRGQ